MASIAILHPAKHPTLEERIALHATLGVDSINDRLMALEREWPAGRAVKVTLGVAIVGGFLLAAWHDPLWLILPIVSGAFLLQYTFFRGSMLTEAFEKLGFRTGAAIDEERLMLRALRGDFCNLPSVHQIEDKDAVHRMEDEGGPAMDSDEVLYDPREAAAIIVTTARSDSKTG